MEKTKPCGRQAWAANGPYHGRGVHIYRRSSSPSQPKIQRNKANKKKTESDNR